MAEFTAKDVQKLRQATGAGMMDAKKALTENDGDYEAAAQWLREKGLAKAAQRSDRDNTQGAVAVGVDGSIGAIVELKCETDFTAKSEGVTAARQRPRSSSCWPRARARSGRWSAQIEDLKLSTKENLEVGRVVRFEARRRSTCSTPTCTCRTAGASTPCWSSSTAATGSWPTTSPCTSPSPSPPTSAATTCPRPTSSASARPCTDITRAEGKPEAAMDKIVEGRLTGWFKERVLLEQNFVRDEKKTIKALLGDATLVRFAQVYIGG